MNTCRRWWVSNLYHSVIMLFESQLIIICATDDCFSYVSIFSLCCVNKYPFVYIIANRYCFALTTNTCKSLYKSILLFFSLLFAHECESIFLRIDYQRLFSTSPVTPFCLSNLPHHFVPAFCQYALVPVRLRIQLRLDIHLTRHRDD